MKRRYLDIQHMKRVDKQFLNVLNGLVLPDSSTVIPYEVLTAKSEYTERHVRRIIRRLEREQVIKTSRVGRANSYEILKHD